jgi:hypothetical protein
MTSGCEKALRRDVAACVSLCVCKRWDEVWRSVVRRWVSCLRDGWSGVFDCRALWTWDMALTMATKLTRSRYLDTRAEFLGVF